MNSPAPSTSASFLRETLTRTGSVDSFVTGVARHYTFATRTIRSRHLPLAALVRHASLKLTFQSRYFGWRGNLEPSIYRRYLASRGAPINYYDDKDRIESYCQKWCLGA